MILCAYEGNTNGFTSKYIALFKGPKHARAENIFCEELNTGKDHLDHFNSNSHIDRDSHGSRYSDDHV